MTILTRDKLDVFKEILIAILHSLVFLPVLHFALELNRVSGIRILAVFFILTQISAILISKRLAFFTVQGSLIIIFLFYLFPPADQSVSLFSWPGEIWGSGSEQVNGLLASELNEVPMILLMTLLFLLITLLTHLAIHIKCAVPSFLVGFAYLMLVHTFSAQRILPEMIQLIGFGFVFIALMQLDTRTTWPHFTKSFILVSLFTLSLVNLSSWAVDRLRPTQEWIEVRSQAYQRELDDRGVFDWINTYSSGVGFRRTGFGVDDSELGGPLRQDYTPLFNAYTSDPHYWKVLHRTEYTGIGWETEESENPRRVYSPYNTENEFTMSADQREEILSSGSISTIPIQWIDQLSYIAYPYGWYDLSLDPRSEEPYILERYETSEYFTLQTETDALNDYIVSYDNEFPSRFDEDLLRVDDGWRLDITDRHSEWHSILEEYYSETIDSERFMTVVFENELQLPPSLPQRVIDLAEELTEGLDNEYDKVRAIEQYLKEDGGYRYSLLEVENTPRGDDYVDHFLFESKIGYCNNFSSAMTVMLRAVGIPARWSKGFTPGSQYVDENGESFFQVTNSNAHSWTEVYFPSYGWIPFEPSPSFANPMTNPEPVANVSGEVYTFENDDFIDLEESAESDTPRVENNVDESLENDPVPEGSLEGTLEADSVTDEHDPDRNWSFLFKLTALSTLLTLTLLVIFRWRVVTKVSILLIKYKLLTTEQACLLVLRLFSFRKKQESGQTIDMYLNQWEPFAPHHYSDIKQFIRLADEVFYGPKKDTEKMSDKQKDILINIVTIVYDLPDLKHNPRLPHPLSKDFKGKFEL